eukprot:1150220-Amphidinium_carterae.1
MDSTGHQTSLESTLMLLFTSTQNKPSHHHATSSHRLASSLRATPHVICCWPMVVTSPVLGTIFRTEFAQAGMPYIAPSSPSKPPYLLMRPCTGYHLFFPARGPPIVVTSPFHIDTQKEKGTFTSDFKAQARKE